MTALSYDARLMRALLSGTAGPLTRRIYITRFADPSRSVAGPNVHPNGRGLPTGRSGIDMPAPDSPNRYGPARRSPLPDRRALLSAHPTGGAPTYGTKGKRACGGGTPHVSDR